MAAQVVTKVLRASTGPVIKAGDQIGVWYQGTLVKDGKQFDANYDFATIAPVAGRQLFSFVLGSGQVIKGWDQALVGRRLGEVLEVVIPADLAYGAKGSPPAIPANAPLRFKVELVGALPAGSKQAIYPTFVQVGVDQAMLAKLDQIKPKVEDIRVGTDQGDVVSGSEKADLLIGLKGGDEIKGGLGADVLIGGAGGNRYVYAALGDSSATVASVDQILDFKPADKINLIALRGKSTPRYIGARSWSGQAGEVRFEAGRLQLDHDGNRQADFEILLNGVSQFTVQNLLL